MDALTIHFALVSLIANSAHERSNAFFSVDSDGHGLLMVAEETSEGSVYAKLEFPVNLKFLNAYQVGPSVLYSPPASSSSSFVCPLQKTDSIAVFTQSRVCITLVSDSATSSPSREQNTLCHLQHGQQ